MNFDKKINRKNTNSIKYDSIVQRFNAPSDAKPLWVADMDFSTPIFVLKSLQNGIKSKVLGYSHIDDEVFNSIIFWQKNRYNVDVKKEQIRLMPSVLSSLSVAICALSNKNDEVIIQTPVYPPFFHIVTSNNRKLIENKLKKVNGKYKMDFDSLEKQITKKTKLLILCSPHNPIGRSWSKRELEKLVNICSKNNITIISDEIHSDMTFKPFNSILNINVPNNKCVVLNSPTKSFNIAGIKVAYIICKNKTIREKVKQETEKRYVDDINHFAPIAIKSAYSKKGLKYIDELNKYLKINVDFTYYYLTKKLPELKIIKNEATYLIWIDFKALNLTHKRIKNKLLYQAKVLLNDGSDFSKNADEKCFRINVALPFKELKKALESIVSTFTPLE